MRPSNRNAPRRGVLRRRAALSLLAAPLTLGWIAPTPLRAAEFSGSITAIARAFDLLHVELRENGQPIQRSISYRPVDANVQLTWDDVGTRGAWSFDTAVRWRTDVASGKGDPALGGWQSSDVDVLVATARWTSRHRLLGLTLGRQNTITSFGWHAFDGVRLDFAKARHVRAFVHAGLPVDLFDGGSPDADGVTYGAGVTGILPRHGSIGVDYEIRKHDADVLSEAVGIDLEVHGGGVRLAANADYSILQRETGEATAVIGGTLRRKHDLELRHSRIRPVFDTDSIFASWELNPYDETRLQYEFRGDRSVSIGGYISVEDYVAPEATDPPADPTDPSDLPEDIERAAATARWESRHGAAHRAEVGWQRGWTGGRLAAAHDSDWDVAPRWRVGAGASANRYENRYRLTEADETWALRGRVRHDHDGRWNLGLEVEQFFGRDRDTTRVTLAFGTRLGKARVRPPWWGGPWTTSTSRRPRSSGDGAQSPGDAARHDEEARR